LHPQSVSIETPNAFSRRSAISGERAARSFGTAESGAWGTPNTRAALVADNPSGSMISAFMNAPGWTGDFMRIPCVALIVAKPSNKIAAFS
jgi:hypothetical protein